MIFKNIWYFWKLHSYLFFICVPCRIICLFYKLNYIFWGRACWKAGSWPISSYHCSECLLNSWQYKHCRLLVISDCSISITNLGLTRDAVFRRIQTMTQTGLGMLLQDDNINKSPLWQLAQGGIRTRNSRWENECSNHLFTL